MKIAIKAGPNAGQEHDLGGSVVVGRDPAAATLLIEDPEASRRHASLTPGASGVTVEDLGSTNGTYVNGERVEGAREAAAGDEIRIGNTVIEVQDAVETTRMAEAPVADPDATAMGAPVPGPPPAPAPSFDAPTPAPPPGPPAAPQAEPGAAEPPPWQPVGGPPAPASTPPPIPEPPAAPPLPAADFGPPPGAGQGYGAPPQQAYQGAPPPMGQPGGPMVPGGYTAASPLKTRESVVEWLLCYFVPFYSLFWFHRAN
ncbi:MAG TPA: FHA domain-containing protein, partial [Thermoleophilaceae bacterium]